MPRQPATGISIILGLAIIGFLCYPPSNKANKDGQPALCPAIVSQPLQQVEQQQPVAEIQPPEAAAVVTPVPRPVTPQPTRPPARPTAPKRVSSKVIDFELPPTPVALPQLPNRAQEPSQWTGGNWGPINQAVDWSEAESPLWERELEVIRQQNKFPQNPIPSLSNGAILYAKNLQVFRAAPMESSSVLEVGFHPVEQKRAPLYGFFKDYLPNSKFALFAKDEPKEGDLAEHIQAQGKSNYHKGVTSEAAAQEEVQKKLQTVDIIVGRAADGISGQLEAFRYFFVNLLRPGGVYFIEDIDMNFISTPDTDECAKSRTLTVDYLRDMISAQISHDWYMTTAGEYRADPFVNNWVQDVSCSRGSCVVTKKLKLFNRYANLVHSSPVADFAPIQTSRPPQLSSLVNRDPHPNTDVSKFGPVTSPVKIGQDLPLWAGDANIFKTQSDQAGSDKCAAIHNGHQYHAMYSKVFAPWRAAYMKKKSEGQATVAKDWKMLEVGIGCDTQGDPAGGYRLYSQYIPNIEYFSFEFWWSKCVTKFRQRAHIRSNLEYLQTHVHTGDQSNYDDLKDCLRKFGTFDLIVDDGSHVSSHMISTFREMFIAALKPGGIFVIEDIQTSFMNRDAFGHPQAEKQRAHLMTVDILRDMIVSLNYPSWVAGYDNKDSLYRFDEPVMNWVEDIMCSREACVIQKRLKPLSAGQ